MMPKYLMSTYECNYSFCDSKNQLKLAFFFKISYEDKQIFGISISEEMLTVLSFTEHKHPPKSVL